MLIYFQSFIAVLKASLIVTRNCGIHIQNLYDATKWILSKCVVIFVLDMITESHKLNSAFSQLIFTELKIIQRTFFPIVPSIKFIEVGRRM